MAAGDRPGPLAIWLAATLVAAAAGIWVFVSEGPEPPLRTGQEAPNFELPALEGQPISLSDRRGRVMFVNFWATWCAPCRDEAPALERLYRRFEGRGFEVLAISIDTGEQAKDVEAFREEFSLSFPILMDPEREAYAAYQATGVPETFLVDARGRIRERFVGPRGWDEPRYARAVERLLAEEGDG